MMDYGLGTAWKKEHFQKNVPNYMLRVDHEVNGETRSYVVDLTDRMVYADIDGDGRVQGDEVLMRDPVGTTREALLAAADSIRKETKIPWPGYESKTHPGFKSGWRLTQKEVNQLKKYRGDEELKGVPAKLTDLERHFLPFNLGDDIEKMGFKENLQGWKILEESNWTALAMAVGSTFKFGKMLKMMVPTKLASSEARRPERSTRIFDKNGNLDQARLATLRAEVEALAKGFEGGSIPEDKFLAKLDEIGALDSLTKRQWGSAFRLINRMYGKREITPELFDKFYSGQLLLEAFDRYAPQKLKDKLASSLPVS